MRRSAARPTIVLGIIGVATWLLLWATGWVLLYDAIAVAAAAAFAVGVWRNRPERRGAWLLLAGGMSAWVLGNLAASAGTIVDGAGPLGGAQGILYVLGYALLGAGLVMLGRGLERDRARRILLDTAVVVLALGLVLWVPTFDTIRNASIHPPLEHVLAFAYPIADLLLLTAAVRIAFAGARGFASAATLASFGSVLAADLLHGSGHPGLGLAADVAWLLGYILLAGAALHPSMRELRPPPAAPTRTPVGRWAFYGTALAMLPLSFLAQWIVADRFADVPLYGSIGLVLTALVVARLALLFADLEHARLEAESSERKFRMIFESAPIGMSLGRDGIMEETNPAFQEMLGYTGEELAERHFLEVTHQDDRNLEAQRELDEGARRAFDAEKRYVRKDGGVVWARVRIVMGLRDGLGLSIVEDVTERRALEEQLRRAQKLEAVGQLAGGVAHDFNNLMTAVSGYSELLLRELDEPEALRKAAAIRDAAARASDLTRQLLAFGRRQVLQVQELDLCDVVVEAERILQRAVGRDVLLATALADTPVPVRVDPAQIERVLVNLATNAYDAMCAGGTLEVAVAADGSDAILTVADTGAGMTEDVREQIFEPFFTTKPLGEATGLGLATVHGIVHQSGGSIEVESAPGRGTRFTIRLPLAGLPLAGAPATID